MPANLIPYGEKIDQGDNVAGLGLIDCMKTGRMISLAECGNCTIKAKCEAVRAEITCLDCGGIPADHFDGQCLTLGSEIVERHFIRQSMHIRYCHFCGNQVVVTDDQHNLAHVGGISHPVAVCDRYLKGEDCRR